MVQRVLERPVVLERRQRSARHVFEHVDVLLVLSALVMAAFGVLMVYSATRGKLLASGSDPHYFLTRQATYVAIGVVVMVAVALIDYHRFEELSLVAYGLMLIALLSVMVIGKSALGSQRWFQLGSFQLQPSAFASLAIILLGAFYCSRHQGEQLTLRRLGLLLVLAGVPVLLVIKQPDLGSGIIMCVILATILIVAGARARYLLLLAALVVLGVFLVIHLGVLKQYQVDRLATFLHQNQHGHSGQSQTLYYNLDQSKTAIGSGGLFGKNLFHGSQTNLAFVPEQQTDFIFTAVGEQLGFVGAASVLGLYGLMVWRILRTAQLAKDPFGRLLCAGVFGYIAFSVFQNAGMTMGIMPITGIPLPLLSYGGSATIAVFAAIGLVLSVSMRRYR